MVKENYIVAAGSPDYAGLLATLFRSEGWLARSVTTRRDAAHFSHEQEDAPRFLVIDVLKEWTVNLARELHPQGTQVILSGFMRESREELESILGVPFYSIMGLPWKAASVLLGKEYDAEAMTRPSFREPSGPRRCERIFGHSFDARLVRGMGIEAVIDPIKRGFSESQGSWMGYIANPVRNVKLVSFMYDRKPETMLTVKEYRKLMNGLIDAFVYQGVRVIATFPIYLAAEDGTELPKSQDDAIVLDYLDEWLQNHPDKDVRLLYIDGYIPRD